MLLRSYALVPANRFLVSADSCVSVKDALFTQIEHDLENQKYPMERFARMKDSMNVYYRITVQMRKELAIGNTASFLESLRADPGYRAWLEFKRFESDVFKFENEISTKAQANYQIALRRSYLLQAILFLITMPTLGYTAYYASKAIQFSEQLRLAKEEQINMISRQKEDLERMVDDRTRELLVQNEEIAAQNEEISARNDQLLLQQEEIEAQRNELRRQNDQLHNAQKVIERQNEQIRERHDDLAREVARQTADIRRTNLELIEHNSRLEQFAYMISHNLRAPLARFVGLSSILKHSRSSEEGSTITNMMVTAAHELDHVIKDLGIILDVRKAGAQLVTEIDLPEMIQKIQYSLSADIKETNAKIYTDFGNATTLSTIPQYLESILSNLISNAIKYRHPERTPEITFMVIDQGEWICLKLSDNGIGIDLERSGDKLFSLYQRFHFHVEGKGLGLYLVKTQVEALGGRIEVQSRPDEGSTFLIYLRRKSS
jgi:signal transduction histidine kinase